MARSRVVRLLTGTVAATAMLIGSATVAGATTPTKPGHGEPAAGYFCPIPTPSGTLHHYDLGFVGLFTVG